MKYATKINFLMSIKTKNTYTLLSVMDMESSVVASLEISLSLALVAGAKM